MRSLATSWAGFIDQVPAYLIAILFIGTGIFLTNRISSIVRERIRQQGGPLMTNFLTSMIRLVFIVMLVMFSLRIAGLHGMATTLMTATGGVAVIIGFAFKDIGENFISGIILTFNRPFNRGDIVKIGDVMGRISSMEFRYTLVTSFDGKSVYIPNSDVIKKTVYNYTQNGNFRMEFIVGVGYQSDLNEVMKFIMQELDNTEGIFHDEPRDPYCLVDELGDNNINIKVLFWVHARDYRRDALMIRSQIIERVKSRLLKEGVSLATNIQEIRWNQSVKIEQNSLDSIEKTRG